MKNIKNNNEKKDSLFVSLLAKYVTYWPIFVIFLVISVSAAIVYLRYTAPKYQATASLIIKDEKKGNEDSKLMESLNLINSKKIIENETEVLQSRPVIENVIKKLSLYAPIYHEGRVLSLSAYKDAPVTIESNNPDAIKGITNKIYLRYDIERNAIFLNNKFEGPANEWLSTGYGTLKFIPNPQFIPANHKRPFYFNLIEKNAAIKNVQDNLKVTATNKLSSIINLQYKDEKPELAEDVLNEIIASYNQIAVNEKNALAKNTLAFIQSRLDIVRGGLDSIENKIQQYKGNKGAVDIGTQGQLFLQNVSINDQRLSDVNMQLSVIDELEQEIKQNDNNTGILPATLGVTDPVLTQLVNNLNTAEQDHEKLKKTVAENNPLLISVTDQITNIKKRIFENIQSYRKNLEANRQNLYATNNSYNNLLHTIPAKEQALLEISRDKNIKSDIYSFLLQKREESELSYASKLENSRVVNYAQASNTPVSPNRLIVLGSLLLAVFGLPIGFIGARETFNTSILYRQDIEEYTTIPIIGELAFNKSKKDLLVKPGERNATVEEFRRLRYSLLYRGVGSTFKKLLISSGISGEGKSFVAVNLATSFSLIGKKVVLVDFDLHNSSLVSLFGMEEKPGVSDYLSGNASIKDIIYPVSEYENLYLISAGSKQTDASGLIESGRVRQLIDQLEEDFDLVVIDSPPMAIVTDAYLLSAYCDSTLYIVKHGYSPKSLIKTLDITNETTPLKDPVIIFNGVKTRGYSNNRYGYGYGYSLMYGAKFIDKKSNGSVRLLH